MNNLIEFLRMFFSYLFVLLVIAVVAGVATFIGIRWRKVKNAKEAEANAEGSEAES